MGRRSTAGCSPYESAYGFARAVRVGDRILVAGTAPVEEDGSSTSGDVAAQTRRCFAIILAAIEELGGGATDVVRTRLFITNSTDADSVGAVHGEIFRDIRPPRRWSSSRLCSGPNGASKSKRKRSLGMMRNRFTLPALLGLALAACQQLAADADIDTDNQVNAAETVSADVGSLPPSEQGGTPLATDNAVGPIDETEDDSENSPSTAVIPTQYRGRWGMNANDCDPRRSDNKGLMTVRDTSIRFYEATASLQEQRPAIATSFSGTFSVAGEGQTWERVMTFTRTGDRLKRVDALGSYSYTRCV